MHIVTTSSSLEVRTLFPTFLLTPTTWTGGTAGCVLASRLSEMEDVSVLVIELGPVADTWASRVPLISGNPYRTGSVAAQWWSSPMHEANSRYQQVMRAEALGGTSRINGLLYTRGRTLGTPYRFIDLSLVS